MKFKAEAAKPQQSRSVSNVVPFPISAQRGLLADLRREASAAVDPVLIEGCLRSRVSVYGKLLADRGIDDPEIIKAEMRSMEWLLLGSVSDNRNGKKKAKKKRCA
jgi:hypothetical protein